MRYLLLLTIQVYWKLKPNNKESSCLYKTACSHHIYNLTKSNGMIAGIKAAIYRIRTCRSGYSLFSNPLTGKVQMLLVNNKMLTEESIADRYLDQL